MVTAKKSGKSAAAPQTDEKLQKVLARAGLGSRREMERAITDGRVIVNGRAAKLGDRVQATDKLELDGKPVAAKAAVSRRRVILYNKPEGEICSRHDPEGRRTVYEALPKITGERWVSVGRLDFNTSGLLLFTNDGDLANKLMHPSSVIDREYLVRIQGTVSDEMKQRLLEGVLLEDGMARFTDIVDGAGESRNRWFYCVVMEGRNREVRRLWESQGVKVSRLKRVRYGNVFMDSDLRMGQWKELDQKVVDTLADSVGLPPIKLPTLAGKVKEKTERLQKKRAGVGAAAKPDRRPKQNKRR